jgi:predicted acyl esterase
MEIAGTPELSVWLTLDAPDTDVVALLYEILPDDGSSILLWSDIQRLRYRKSWREPELATPGVPFEFAFGMPKFMSRRLRRGSRLRLVIRSPASINYQKNLHSGKLNVDELPGDARRCTVKLHHEPGRQSVLRLPVSRPTPPGGPVDR